MQAFAVGKARVRYNKRCRPCWAPIQREKDKLPETRYSYLKTRSKGKGIPVEITREEYVSLISGGKCHYCEGSLAPYGGGLDRIDHTQSYKMGNCVPCCPYCNECKGRGLTYDEMKIMGQTNKLLRERREKLGLPPLMCHIQIELTVKRKGRYM